ncbi:MAG: ArsI/CadI family heavy metal resistance metalloenzyme [Burkholderiales bacterium]
MKRFHVHIAVDDLGASTKFYAALFGAPPTVEKEDYAKWMLDDPHLNFAISARGNAIGVNHLGFQADSAEELEGIYARLQTADAAILPEEGASCCYAKSDKYWVTDPSGIAWESFHTLGTVPTFNGKPDASATPAPVAKTSGSACCAPATQVVKIATPTVSAKSTKGACCG